MLAQQKAGSEVETEQKHKHNKVMEENAAQEIVQNKEQEANQEQQAQPNQKEKILKELEPNLLQRIAANKFTPPILTLLLMTALFILSFHIASINKQGVSPEDFQREPIPTAAIKMEETKQEEEDLEEIDTSDWETYQNEEYGFAIQYPPGSELIEDNTDFKIFISDDEFPYGSYVSVDIIETPGSSPLSDLGNNKFATDAPEPYELDWSETEFAETYALTTTRTPPGDSGTQTIYIFESEGIVFTAWRTYVDKDSDTKYFDLSEKVLFTFEFVENDVQGATITSCLEENQEILAEIQTCEEISEARCVLLKADFDECMDSCQENLSEEACIDVCRPVCEEVE